MQADIIIAGKPPLADLQAATDDRNEGINAFLEKRKPIYKGH